MQLESSDLLESHARARRRAGVQDVAVFGGGLHVTVDDADAADARIRAALDSRDHRDQRLEPITPSMEDVFVSLIEARNEKGGRMSFRRLRAMLRKELLHIMRDPRSLAWRWPFR